MAGRKEWTDVTQQAIQSGIEAKTITWSDWLALARTLATAAELVVNKKCGKEDFRVMLANSLAHTKSVGGWVSGDKALPLVRWWLDYEPLFETIKADPSVLDHWYVNKNGQSYGPFSSTEMCNFLENENVSVDDEIARIDLLRAKKLRDLGSDECNRSPGQQAVYSRVCTIRNAQRIQTIKNFLCGAGKVVGGVAIITGMVALAALAHAPRRDDRDVPGQGVA